MDFVYAFIITPLLIVACASIVPIITFIYNKYIKKEESKEVYMFSEELFEAEYSNRHIETINREFEQKKIEEYNIVLP